MEIEAWAKAAEVIRINRELLKANELLQAKIDEHKRMEDLLRLQRDLAITLSNCNELD